MELANETRERIFSAADSLYEQAGHTDFPTVDAVRKIARVNMNDASLGMKQWRRAHTLQAAPTLIQVPESVRQASTLALSVLWRDAQQVAEEGLHLARARWETERLESETLHRQLADAFEVQAAEFTAASDEITRLRAEIVKLRSDKADLAKELQAVARDLVSGRAAVEREQVRSEEMCRSAKDLRNELDHSHNEAARLRSELERERKKRTAETAEVREALKSTLARVEAERDTAVQCANEARELAAALRGQLDLAKEQTAALLQMVSTTKRSRSA
jgi:colicin import membrane protein